MDQKLKQDKKWFAVYTKPRCEKKLAERLEAKGYQVYCPLQTSVRKWSDRWKKVKTPILRSYLLVRVRENQRTEILQDPAALNFVFWLGRAAVIKDEEINRLKNFLEENEGSEFEVKQLKPGTKVELARGPFIGQSAKVDRVNGNKLYLILDGLGLVLKVKSNAVIA